MHDLVVVVRHDLHSCNAGFESLMLRKGRHRTAAGNGKISGQAVVPDIKRRYGSLETMEFLEGGEGVGSLRWLKKYGAMEVLDLIWRERRNATVKGCREVVLRRPQYRNRWSPIWLDPELELART